ncbi:phosphoadenosine phosphosulfate reductase family protein [Cutibacterium avidum]|uniref:phosphoadenosine phosphosulfate reductase domain-containing protein n=1 Tax=Cutibacterium avidum TaxID=33010 RepID=UPI002095E2E1|nr:phosphoadenosine phosphosulfate reductase family protein [Cutibacterium avidum]MCO6688317.1 phosphoadenosine phosphosulfate reductase family protein [Cutibacterium avidum]MDU5809323.1 phosphoadenosine phosphosulfate reductase family protein [Finegoldia magna]MDU5841455.1 phosphoadenosine phosphosulfate reductase family protein [Cutibacterium avidum]MDU7429464.1 phosphoadenosine phosphosulfate reductase family protein [Cutibacterium avidum]
MLIPSPRFKPGDLDHWRSIERYDARLAQNPSWPRREARAKGVITDFAGSGPCYVSTSWGKDSTVVAHLAATSGLVLPLVYVRMRRYENPDCLTVRDAFLERWGDYVDYHEYWVSPGPRWWQIDDLADAKRTASHVGGQFHEAEVHHGSRHISGVRAEESRMRAMAMGRWGEAGPGACRPIGRWTAVDVFAYLHRHDLPVHPAYAMSMRGRYDRRWLRVSPIGGITQAHKDRAGWETTYYPDVIDAPGAGAQGGAA